MKITPAPALSASRLALSLAMTGLFATCAVAPALAADPAYVGTWGKDAAQCSVPQEQEGAPMIVTKKGYDQHEVHCTFKSVKKTGSLWKIVAQCSVQGDNQTDSFTLKGTGKMLMMTRGKFSTKLKRCN